MLDVVKGHVFKDEGRIALKAVMALCHKEPDYDICTTAPLLAGRVDAGSCETLLVGLLDTHGPALDSGFQVTAGEGTFSFSGNAEVQGDKHSMLMVGTRVSDNGDRTFLLQNWWRSKQFIVSLR